MGKDVVEGEVPGVRDAEGLELAAEPGEAAEDAEGEAAEGQDAAVGETGHVDGKEGGEGVFGRQAAGIIEITLSLFYKGHLIRATFGGICFFNKK